MELVLDFTNPEATELEQSGGKGASLARLVQADFPVPGGFVVTASAYREFIAGDSELGGQIAALDFKDANSLFLDNGGFGRRGFRWPTRHVSECRDADRSAKIHRSVFRQPLG
jgi:hypothetical protein